MIENKTIQTTDSLAQSLNTRVSFPIFIKILIIFLVFGFLPTIAILLIFLWDETSRIQVGFLTLLSMGMIFGGILFSVKILLSPLSRLLEGVRRLSRGEYGVEIKIKSKDEFFMFADYFNQMSQKLKLALEREKAISQMKSEFISLAAHQLRTPLSALKWTMRMMLDGDAGQLNQEQKEFLEKGYQSNERIIGLINDLLDVAKIEEGRFGYNFTYEDVVLVIEKAIEEGIFQPQARNVRIDFKKPIKLLPKIKIDFQKIKLAIENLLENAVNYTRPGGLVEINVGPYNRDYLEIKIKDNGIGIPEYQMPRLFTKFFRGENVMKMQTDGSGLGLFIAKNIVKRHGGEIWIESKEGEGTTVHFTLPLSERLIPEKEEAFEEFITGF